MFHTLAVIANVLSAGLAVCVFAVVGYNWYRDRELMGWMGLAWYEKCWFVARDSATWFVQYATLIAAAVLQNLDYIARALHAPEITTVLDKYFDPKVVGYVLLAAGLVNMWARARTLVT